MSRGFGGGGGGGGGQFANLMKQASMMQGKIAQVQDSLKERQYESTSGGGAVHVVINGSHRIQRLKINAEAAGGDAEMLADLVIIAFNDALQKCQDEYDQEMKKVTGGVNLPGL